MGQFFFKPTEIEDNNVPEIPRCQGVTKKGRPCTQVLDKDRNLYKDDYCHLHQDQAPQKIETFFYFNSSKKI